MNSRLFTFMIFDRLDVSGQVMRVGIKSFFGFYCSLCSPLVFY
ncbi:hypothetical protein LTSEWAN_6385 [Salmonella enterica subsp. enterica serovar Wandsworth str. A4-580]|uniref:Uncharacterized protein n=1 Tax=Salmonella enterica subsp. enterica serovar Wandsworth str. A4-580 TaxID=913086 RepID=G5SKM9_SALET|nr:hypothetical protein LTSEWAN_6385 [Salmonella enterica subsp. enterica serovar Wandsworth str. A4-580]